MGFQRGEAWRYKKLGKSWRKPRGRHSKMRKRLGGKMASPTIGYGTKDGLRGLHPSGYREVLVYNPNALDMVDKETQAVRIAAGVGKRKRGEILKKAKKLKLVVLNYEL
ncbi:MAG: 50S ribosomal protein L32e [Candidatus Hydrothermarchaeota archaeon]|jgi:large subunit ribosomal protein L32e|nr:50S ribosomal protein L32e [Candidatus Hydrothermarchaeota archaeon]